MSRTVGGHGLRSRNLTTKWSHFPAPQKEQCTHLLWLLPPTVARPQCRDGTVPARLHCSQQPRPAQGHVAEAARTKTVRHEWV